MVSLRFISGKGSLGFGGWAMAAAYSSSKEGMLKVV